MAMSKIKGLQMWCRKMAEGYPRVDIANFTTAWRDGLAFCAIIHRFRPDLIDFDSLSPENVFDNCKLAFEVAERELSIPAFLEAEDMVRLKVPDKLSIITYVSQYYNFLHSLPQLGGPGVKTKSSNKTVSGIKRPTDSDALQAPIIKKASTTESKENSAPETERPTTGADKCGICQNHVYLMERLMEGGKLYHRSCFRHSELSPANKVYSRSPYLSPSLGSEAQMTTITNKSSVPSGVGKSIKGININRQIDNEQTIAASDASYISKKTDNFGSKHPLYEPDRDDTKKYKMQPKALFGDDNLKKTFTIEDRSDKHTNSNNKNSESSKNLPLSTKEAKKFEKRQKEIVTSEKATEELSKRSHQNMPLIFQQKVTSTSKIPSTSAAATTPIPVAATRNIAEAKSTATHFSTFNAALPSHPNPEIVQSKYKPTSTKDDQKPLNEKQLDTALSKTSALPSVQNLQKMFSSKPVLDSSEPAKPTHPVARPRSGVFKPVSEESSSNNLPSRSSAEERKEDMNPKPSPRKSMFEILEPATVLKQQDVSAQSDKSTWNTDSSCSELKKKTTPAAGLPPALPQSAPPPLPTVVPMGEIVPVPADKNSKKALAARYLQESKASFLSAKHTEDPKNTYSTNISHSLHHKIDSSKTAAQDNSKIKLTENGSNVNVSSRTNVKQNIVSGSAVTAETNLSIKPSNQKLPTDKEQVALSVPAKKEDTGKVLSGLLSSLAGIRGQLSSSQGPSNHTVSSPANISASTPSSNLKVKTETISTSSTNTPVSKIIVANSTPVALSVHSMSRPDTSSVSRTRYPATNSATVLGSQTKSNAEKTTRSQEHKDTTVSVKTLTDTTSLSTSNKVPEAGAFRSQTGTTPITPTNQSSSKPEKISNGPHKSGLSQNVDTHKKDTATSKVPFQYMSQNSDGKNTSSNLISLKNNENKSENRDAKSDTKQSTFYLAPTHQAANSIEESQSQSLNKHKSLSSSKEDLHGMNNIKLRSVMPERKVVQDEPKTIVYDVKLKKVDVIKGDTKWDIAPQKPERSLNRSETSGLDKDAGLDKFVKSNQNQNRDLSSSEGVGQKLSVLTTRDSHSSVAVTQKPSISNDLLQWKKDVEERKKKFEPETGQPKHLRGIDDSKTAVNSDKKLDLASKEKAPEAKNVSEETLLPKKHAEVSLEKDSASNAVPKKNGRKLSPTRENQGKTNKLDWQLEAEKRMATLAGFDKEVIGKIKETDKPNIASSDIPTNQPKKDIVFQRSEEHLSNINHRNHNGDKMKGHDKNFPGTALEKGSTKLKESKVEFVLNKSKLKSVEVDISALPVEEIDKSNNEHRHKTHAKTGKVEDFRNVLHQLKRVTTVESGQVNLLQADDEVDSQHEPTRRDILPPMTKPLLNNFNKNNNNKPFVSEQNHTSDVNHIHQLNKNGHIHVKTTSLQNSTLTPVKTTGLQSSTDENSNEKKIHISNPPEEKLVLGKVNGTNEKKDTSPKVKRKITPNKVTEISSPSSLKHKKKIEVTTKYDFEKSSDFEHSLSKSTAELTIRQTHTTPSRPPAPHTSHITPSPNQISAIELQSQMQDIETKLTELELKGRQLEDSIRRDGTKEGHRTSIVNDLEDDDDQLMIEWFSLINEKNDLVRKESDLIYISRDQKLEDEQEQIESQLRYLLSKPDECKSPEEKQEEDYLIQHKLSLVEQRNKIVDNMDEDRIRYEDEDKGIELILKDKGYWKDSTGTLKALKGKKVAKSVFYA